MQARVARLSQYWGPPMIVRDPDVIHGTPEHARRERPQQKVAFILAGSASRQDSRKLACPMGRVRDQPHSLA
jgi:hypothetical protein